MPCCTPVCATAIWLMATNSAWILSFFSSSVRVRGSGDLGVGCSASLSDGFCGILSGTSIFSLSFESFSSESVWVGTTSFFLSSIFSFSFTFPSSITSTISLLFFSLFFCFFPLSFSFSIFFRCLLIGDIYYVIDPKYRWFDPNIVSSFFFFNSLSLFSVLIDVF